MILAPLDAPKFIKPAVILVLELNCVDNLVSELWTFPSPTSDAVVPLLIVDTEVVAPSANPLTSPEVIFNPEAVMLTVPVLPLTDCTGAPAESIKLELLFKSDIFLPEILILAALIVPVVILPPSIVVDPLEPMSAACSGSTVVLPSESWFPEPVKVISPLNPIPCCEA